MLKIKEKKSFGSNNVNNTTTAHINKMLSKRKRIKLKMKTKKDKEKEIKINNL